MKTLVLTQRHADAYQAFRADLLLKLDRRLALRRAGRPERQRAALQGAATKRRAR